MVVRIIISRIERIKKRQAGQHLSRSDCAKAFASAQAAMKMKIGGAENGGQVQHSKVINHSGQRHRTGGTLIWNQKKIEATVYQNACVSFDIFIVKFMVLSLRQVLFLVGLFFLLLLQIFCSSSYWRSSYCSFSFCSSSYWSSSSWSRSEFPSKQTVTLVQLWPHRASLSRATLASSVSRVCALQSLKFKQHVIIPEIDN